MLVRDVPFSRDEEFDLAIGVCGYEPRSSYVCRLGVSASRRLALTYAGTISDSFDRNRQAFIQGKWSLIDADQVERVLDGVLAEVRRPRILVDISSMTRQTMARLVQYCWEHSAIDVVHFVYAPARFESSAAAANMVPSLTAGPLSEYFAGSLRSPSIPVGLILGLGLEEHRANGLVELMEPSRLWAFVALSDDDRFAAEVQQMHSGLFSDESAAMLLYYDIHSMAELYNSLDSLVFSAGLSYRLLLAPSGPKIFSLASLLVGVARTATRPAIWRVGSAQPASGYSDVVEAGDVVASIVGFQGETESRDSLR